MDGSERKSKPPERSEWSFKGAMLNGTSQKLISNADASMVPSLVMSTLICLTVGGRCRRRPSITHSKRMQRLHDLAISASCPHCVYTSTTSTTRNGPLRCPPLCFLCIANPGHRSNLRVKWNQPNMESSQSLALFDKTDGVVNHYDSNSRPNAPPRGGYAVDEYWEMKGMTEEELSNQKVRKTMPLSATSSKWAFIGAWSHPCARS